MASSILPKNPSFGNLSDPTFLYVVPANSVNLSSTGEEVKISVPDMDIPTDLESWAIISIGGFAYGGSIMEFSYPDSSYGLYVRSDRTVSGYYSIHNPFTTNPGYLTIYYSSSAGSWMYETYFNTAYPVLVAGW